jgi:predicted anti-sigma-YlaC factor YlaD
MAIEHLTDQQIQDYLDGNLTEDAHKIEEHIESCKACQAELARYKSISTALSEDIGFELSPNFASEVVASIQEKGAERFFFRLSHIILWATGVLAGIALLIRFTDIENVFYGFAALGESGEGIVNVIATSFQKLIESTGLDVRFVGMVAVVLLGIYLIDRLIMRARRNITSTGMV